MGQVLLPVFFLITSVGLFFTYIDGKYTGIQVLLAEQDRLDQALTKSKELQEVRNALISRYNTFTREELDRLQKLLPDHIDNVRLIIDIDNIAATYNLPITEFGFTTSADPAPEGDAAAGDAQPYGSVTMDFSVTATYADFLKFLRDLERSLRLVDVTKVQVSGGDAAQYQYHVTIVTYWLH